MPQRISTSMRFACAPSSWMYARELGSTLCIRGFVWGGSGMGPKNSTPIVISQRRVSFALSTNRRRRPGLSRSASRPANLGISAKCESALSSMPAFFCCGVPVAVKDPMDHAVVPPSSGFFSINIVAAPVERASIAAARPAPPPPITSTSHTYFVSFATGFLPVFLRA